MCCDASSAVYLHAIPAVTSVKSWHLSMQHTCSLCAAAVSLISRRPCCPGRVAAPSKHRSRSRLPAGSMRAAVACKPAVRRVLVPLCRRVSRQQCASARAQRRRSRHHTPAEVLQPQDAAESHLPELAGTVRGPTAGSIKAVPLIRACSACCACWRSRMHTAILTRARGPPCGVLHQVHAQHQPRCKSAHSLTRL